ncbi:MAG: PilZ domain-containing protein [Magnetococcales bacterium]|nr:PilZ domain-containing protein [Magnetococcales bacterium]
MNEEWNRAYDPKRRRHERVLFNRQAVLELTGGRKIFGLTKNVSLAGIFFVTNKVEGIETGSVGTVRLTGSNLQNDFPCQVVHVRPNGMGLMFTGKGEHFAFGLSNLLMQETHTMLGAEVDSGEWIRVQRFDFSPPGRLYKISPRNMEFGFPVSPEWDPKIGESLCLEILPLHQAASIPVVGMVRLVMTGDPRSRERANERVCVFLFSELKDSVVRQIQELVSTLHSRRLNRIVNHRAASMAFQSDAELPRPSRQEIGRHLEKFYGFKR